MYVTLTFKAIWQFKDAKHIKITKDKMIINCKTNSILKYTTRGFYINGRYLKRNDINKYIEPINLTPSQKMVKEIQNILNDNI